LLRLYFAPLTGAVRGRFRESRVVIVNKLEAPQHRRARFLVGY
jgi:hypothetical protein